MFSAPKINGRPFKHFSAPAKIVFAVILGVAAGCVTSHAQLTTIAYDGFNYSAGALAGQSGGTGWTNAWVNDYTQGATLDVNATGMTYTGLSVTGGSVLWGAGGNGISEDSRTLALQDSGILYLQFLCQFGSSSGGGTPNIRLYNSGALTGGFGGNGGTYGNFVSILNASLAPSADGSSSSSASLSAKNFVVARIDYQSNTTMMWVNPDLSTFDYQNPTNTPAATYAGLAPAFNKIAIYSRSPANVDEIKIMALAVPEPSAAGLLGLGALMLGWDCRRRRQNC